MKLTTHLGLVTLFATLLALPIAAAPGSAPMQPPDIPDKLDLHTAISYALENNYAIRQAKERIREQEGLIVEVKAQALPNASIDSSYNKNADKLSSDLGVPNPSTQTWRIALNVRQTLYAGGGVRAALNAQKALREAALLDLQGTINTALLDVRTKFYNVLFAKEQITVQEQNVQLLTEQVNIAKNRFEVGASSNFEVLQAQVSLANAQPALIRAHNGYRTAIDQLRQSLGFVTTVPGHFEKIPEFVGALTYEPVKFELAKSLESARLNRPELQRYGRIEEARAAGVRVAQANYLPDLSLVGGYLFRKSNYSERFNDSLDGWQVGLQSNWAVFDGRATTGRVMQAKSQLRQAQLTTSEFGLGVEVEVRTALSSLQEAAELVASAQQTVEQAKEALRLADARYAAGTATQLDVLTARLALTESRNNELQAHYSYNVAVATARKAIGESDPFVVNQR